jgi:hypothetical protein
LAARAAAGFFAGLAPVFLLLAEDGRAGFTASGAAAVLSASEIGGLFFGFLATGIWGDFYRFTVAAVIRK